MTLEAMFEKLDACDYATDYIVRLKYKYDWENQYEYSNEVLESYDGRYVWLNDWNEGQKDVEVLGFVAIEDIPVKKVVKWLHNCGADTRGEE